MDQRPAEDLRRRLQQLTPGALERASLRADLSLATLRRFLRGVELSPEALGRLAAALPTRGEPAGARR